MMTFHELFQMFTDLFILVVIFGAIATVCARFDKQLKSFVFGLIAAFLPLFGSVLFCSTFLYQGKRMRELLMDVAIATLCRIDPQRKGIAVLPERAVKLVLSTSSLPPGDAWESLLKTCVELMDLPLEKAMEKVDRMGGT